MISLTGLIVATRRALLLSCSLAAFFLAFGCREPARVLLELDEARALTASVRVQFNKADDASNRAVMADTDEASIAFARDAEKATRAVESDVAALAPRLQHLGFSSELKAFRDFQDHFAKYKKVDQEILALAVENTNLKAQSLAFGPSSAAADKFRDSLASVAAAFPAKDRCRVDELVARATLAVREIQVLQNPHIASASDAQMTQIEQQVAELERSARDALKALDALAPADAHALPAAALAALDSFKEVHGRIVELSRRNTNVRSLDLALRAKPALVNACDDSLRSVQEALANEGSKATR